MQYHSENFRLNFLFNHSKMILFFAFTHLDAIHKLYLSVISFISYPFNWQFDF